MNEPGTGTKKTLEQSGVFCWLKLKKRDYSGTKWH